MKSFKIFFLSALVATASLFTACVENTDIEAATPVSEDCMEVYFVASESDSEYVYDVATNASEIVIPVTVARTYAANAVTLPLFVQQEGTMFNVPSSVEFASGQAETTFNVTLNNAEVGVHNLNISLGDDVTIVNPYLSVGAPIYGVQVEFYRWAKVCDATLESALGITRNTILENKEGTMEYRLPSLWADGYDFLFTLSADGKSYTIPQSQWIGTMSGYPVIETGVTLGGYPLWGAFDPSVTYSYFLEGQGMVISIYFLTSAAQYGWFDEVVYFSAE